MRNICEVVTGEISSVLERRDSKIDIFQVKKKHRERERERNYSVLGTYISDYRGNLYYKAAFLSREFFPSSC